MTVSAEYGEIYFISRSARVSTPSAYWRWKSEISSVEMTVYHKTLFERT
jgi:hypothetical protein